MEKNNIKYFICSIGLLGTSLDLAYNVFYSNTIYLYEHFDFTGVTKTIQMVMTAILLVISAICLMKSIQAREDGVDFLFNKSIAIVFIIYTVLSICAYICVRSVEESTATKMLKDIKENSQSIKKNELGKNKINNKNLSEYDFYNTISEALSESEYAINDKYYERKKEIINQVENSSKIERYSSMLFYNYSYKYYSPVILDEIEYYSIFLDLSLVGVVGAIFYLFNAAPPKDSGDIFYKKENTTSKFL